MNWRLICVLSFILYHSCFSQDAVECEEANACEGMVITQSNVKELKCTEYRSCAKSTFTLSCSTDSNCQIECAGEESCDFATISIDSVEKIICEGCQGAVITVTNPADDFVVECKEEQSCKDLQLTVTVPADSEVDDFNGILCEKEESCQNAQITITNLAANLLSIEELQCEAKAACAGLVLSITGNHELEECECGDEGGCIGATGIEDCYTGIEELECKGSECVGQTFTIINPENGFYIICNEPSSCVDTTVHVVINDDMDPDDAPFVDFKGIVCGSDHACDGLIVSVDNQQSDGSVVVVGKIECGGNKACLNAEFDGNFAGNVVFEEIKCDGNCGSGANVCLAESSGGYVACTNGVFSP